MKYIIHCHLKNLRQKQELTQEELAEKLGISRQALIALEQGKSLPSLNLALEMSSLFEKSIEEIFFDEDFLMPIELTRRAIRTPSVNVYEKEKNVIVEAQLPGIKIENVDIEVADNYVSLSGEQKEEKEDKDKNFYRKEVSYGSFSRVIPLPVKVKSDKVEAEAKDGILKITLPKTEVKKAKKLKIKVKK